MGHAVLVLQKLAELAPVHFPAHLLSTKVEILAVNEGIVALLLRLLVAPVRSHALIIAV
jgi:hypothetical protein